MSHGNEMICQPVTLSGYAEWPKVADAMIEAFTPTTLTLGIFSTKIESAISTSV
jgi:hypothetical protein